MIRIPRFCCYILACVLLGAAAPQAQPPAATAPAAPPRPGDQPPAVTFAREGITLEEAVRLALQWDPQIQLQRAGQQFREGVLQEQAGFFDTSFRANVSHDFRRQELPESRKEFEEDRRQRLRDGIADNTANAERAQQLLGLVTAVRAQPPGSTQVDALAQIDPDIGTQVRIIDALILETTNPQARADLINARQQYLDRTTANLQEGLEDALQNFDVARETLDLLGATPIDEVFYSTRARVSFAKIFRNGIAISPFLDSSVEGTNFAGKPRSSDRGGKGVEDLFTFRLGTNLTFPLARGRTADTIAAGERAARVERDVSELTTRHQLSLTALQTALAYWDLRAAQQAVDIAQASLASQSEIVGLTRKLIAADDLPASELARTEAAEARARARVRDAERRLVEARVALATIMGVAAGPDDTSLPLARDPFPTAPAAGSVRQTVAVEGDPGDRRPDLLAAVQREEVSRILERRAFIDQRPRLDLVTGIWYTALDERRLSNAVDRWVGPSTNVGLELERPFGNNLSRGRVVQSQADLAQRRIATADMRRQIQLQTVRIVASIEEASERVRLAEEAVGHYARVVDAEFQRFGIGEATLIDTILTETQRAEAQLALVNAQRDLARLLAELRFETGTLVENGALAGADLATIPAAIRR
jgi:outer membrane protein